MRETSSEVNNRLPSDFELGKFLVTKGVNELIASDTKFSMHVLICMARHKTKDWGDLDEEDKRLNDEAVLNGDRILSAYHHEKFPKIWIITECDRSATTVMFPSEY